MTSPPFFIKKALPVETGRAPRPHSTVATPQSFRFAVIRTDIGHALGRHCPVVQQEGYVLIRGTAEKVALFFGIIYLLKKTIDMI